MTRSTLRIFVRLRPWLVAASLLACADPATAQVITTVAGGGVGDGGPAVNASLAHPATLILEPSGDLLIADSANNRIRRVTSGSGTISTIAGTGAAGFLGDNGPAQGAYLNGPMGLARASNGDLYVADFFNNRIRKATLVGIFTVAGNGAAGSSGDGGAAVDATLNGPAAVALDSSGNLFIADFYNHRVRKVSTNGVITTVAGAGSSGFGGDNGPATAASLSYPAGVTVDSSGVLYIADYGNNRIRRVSTGGTITTIAGGGSGSDNGLATSAFLYGPLSVFLDTSGNILIAESFGNRVRKVALTGIITTVAGTGTPGFSGDNGPAKNAMIDGPSAVTVDSSGNVYVADENNNRIRKISALGVITTIAGGCGTCGTGDNGPATNGAIGGPSGVTLDASGNMWIADALGSQVRKVSAAGTITTVAGTGTYGYGGDNSAATGAMLRYPDAVAVDASGNLYIADSANNRVRKVTPGGVITTVAGNGAFGYGGDNGPATSATLFNPSGVAVDSSGNLYIADSSNNRVRMVTPGGMITTVVGTGAYGFFGDNGAVGNAKLAYPVGLAFDASGNLYIADYGNNRVRKVSVGTITTVAGGGAEGNVGDNGPATSAYLSSPRGIVLDPAGNLYIADSLTNRIRKVSTAGVITTVGGTGNAGFSGDNGPAPNAELDGPQGLALDGNGNLYVADMNNRRIRKIALTAPPDPPRLSNISTRGQVLTGNDVMIAGLIIGGPTSKTVVVNVAGPSLASAGITNPLANPTLTLVRSSDNAVIAVNDDWQNQSPANVAAIQASGLQPNHALEPAIIATLAPGNYTAIVSGVSGGTGVGLVGVFEVDHPEVPLFNLSTRGQVLTGNDVMIAGFIVRGTGSQRVVVTVAGPSLTNAGITNPLANPTMTLVRGSDNSVIAANDDWQNQSAANVTAIQDSGLQPLNPLEPAIIATLAPGAYTVIVSGVGGGTGVALIGVFTR